MRRPKPARACRTPTSPGRMPSGLSRHEARPPRCSSAIGLMQKKGITTMTHLSNGTVATDIDATEYNAALTAQGYTVRHIETWHDHDSTIVVWDAPDITDADLPF